MLWAPFRFSKLSKRASKGFCSAPPLPSTDPYVGGMTSPTATTWDPEAVIPDNAVVVERKFVLLGVAPAVNGVAYFRANP